MMGGRAVATVKGLWRGGEDKLKALMMYRATLECGYSPAQLLIGRQLRTTIPQLPASPLPLRPNIRGFRKLEKARILSQFHQDALKTHGQGECLSHRK
uniref:Uncharacterized protein n=1 Tax=Labrus bergylta TaxID=56723 RepID=A0A3Q3GHF7_9LABR